MAKRSKKKSKAHGGERKHHHQPAHSQHQSHSHPKPAAAASGTFPAAVLAAFALGVVGIVLTAYLTFTKWFGERPAYCTDGSGCDLVQESRWSMLLGLPLSFWGLLTYVVLIALLWRQRRKPSLWRWTWWVAAFGFLFSAYLTAVSVVEIEATCPYCLASFGIVTLMLALVTLSRPRGLQNFSWPSYATGAIGSAALLIVALHMHYSGVFDPAVGPEKPYLKALATHLTESGAVFYGAYWCPGCNEQKSLFEASVHRLPYQECSPDGRTGPRALACTTKNIEAFPTWIIGNSRYPGVLEPKVLAAMSGFQWNEPGSQ